MASILSWAKKTAKNVENHAQAVVAQVNPLDNGRTYNTVRQQGAAYAPKAPASVVQQATHNGATNVVGSSLVKPLVNTARMPFDVTRLAEANILRNKTLADQARIDLGKSANGSIFGAVKPLGADLANVAYQKSGALDRQANRQAQNEQNLIHQVAGNSPKANMYADLYANAEKQGVYGQALASGGINLNDSNGTLLRKTGGKIAAAASPTMYALAPEALAGKTALGTAAKVGTLNAANSVANVAQTDATLPEYLKQGAVGFAAGAALPLALSPAARGLALKGGKLAATKTTDIAIAKPYRNISDQELQAVKRVAQRNAGFGDDIANVQPNDTAIYRNVQRKLGADTNDHGAIDQLIAARQNHATQMQQRAATVQNIGNRLKVSNEIGAVGKNVKDTAADVPTSSTKVKLPKAQKPTTRPQIPGTSLPKVTKNSLTSKVKYQNLSPEAQALVQGEGFVRNTKQLAEAAAKTANKQSLTKNIQQAHESMSVPAGQIDDSVVAHVQQAMERADAAGRTNDAVALHDALSEHLRKQGQTIQAASLLYRLSPQGLFYKGIKDIKRSGTELTPELQNRLKSQADAIKAATTPDAKQQAQATFHKTVADNLKKSNAQNALSVWKAGLLSGPLTQAGNFASNATFGALKKISDIPATAIDKGLSLATGQRTKTLTGRGIASGTREGSKSGITTMKTGIDARNIEGSKYEIHGEINFKNPVIQKVFGNPSNLVFRGMSAADQPFYYAALKNNLYDVAKADGLNRGLKGSELTKHVANMVDNPTTKMAETAKLAAQKAVLGQDSKIASSISKIAQEHPALQAVVPFVKVPTNFLTRTLDYSPVGFGKAGVKAIRDLRAGKPLDQRALAEALGEATTGSAVVALGAELANSNLLSGQYPSTDQKEAQRWRAEGIQPNSVKVGGKWINLNYLGPAGLLLGAGKDYHTAAAQGDNGAMQAIAGLGKGIAGQSFLTGFSGAANAINDPGRYGANFVHSQASSVVPAWVNAVGNATDGMQRQASNTADSVKARIPVVRNSLPAKQDVYGNPLKQRTNPLDITIDPLKPSNDLGKKNSVVSEVNRLHTVDPNNSDLQVTPTPVKGTLKIDKQNIKLSDKQQYALQNKIGQATQAKWGELIKSDQYKSMDDTKKAAALDNIRKLATEDATRSYVVANNLGTYSKPESKKAIALNQGSASIDSLATAKGKGNSTAVALTGDKRGSEFLNNYNALSSDRKKSWSAGPLDPKYKDVYDTSSKIKPAGMPDLPKKNTTLKAYADYLKANQSAANELERNKARGEFLKTAYKADISKPAQDLFGTGYTTASKIDAIKSGDISKTDLENAIGLDNLFVKNGLTSKPSISKSVRAEFGYSTPSTGSGRRTTGRRKGSGRRVSSRKGIPTSVSAIKTPRINTKAKGFKSVSVKAPTFKASHKSLPKQTAYKTPKVTKVA